MTTNKSMTKAEKAMNEAVSYLKNRQARELAALIHGAYPNMDIFYDEMENNVTITSDFVTIKISG